MNDLAFSVVTPSFNQGDYIEGCIQSVLNQGVTRFEHIIVDNCSTDATHEIVRRYPHVSFISEPDNGQSHALNKGFRRARGNVICWLNTDDEYVEGAFETVGKYLMRSEAVVVYGDTEAVKHDASGTTETMVYKPHFTSRYDLLRYWERGIGKLHQPAVFFLKDVLQKVGYLREDLHFIMDQEFWWRVSEMYNFHYVDQVLARQNLHVDCKSWRSRDKFFDERRRVFLPLLAQHIGHVSVRDRLAIRKAEGLQCFRASVRLQRKDPVESGRLFVKAFVRYPKLALSRSYLAEAVGRLGLRKERMARSRRNNG